MGCTNNKPAQVTSSPENFDEEFKKYEEVNQDYVIAYDNMIRSQIYYYILFKGRFICIGKFQGFTSRIFQVEGKGLISQDVLIFQHRYIVLGEHVRERVFKLKNN